MHEVNYCWDLCCSDMLRGLDWYLFSEAAEQLIGIACKNQAVHETSVTSYNSTLRNIPHRGYILIYNEPKIIS